MTATLPPLFVLGAPRSGTSLVYKALALHPDAGWINNYHRRLPALWPVAVLNRLTRHTRARRRAVWFGAAGDSAYRYAAARGLAERLYPQPVEGEPVFARCGIPPAWPGGTLPPHAHRLAPMLRRTARAGGGRVLVSKRIGHNRRVPLLDAVVPGARFLVVTRDGRAVTDSLLKVDWWPETELWWWRPGGLPADWEAAGGNARVAAARHWVAESEAIAAGVRDIPPVRLMHVSYEALLIRPAALLAEIAGFAGLDPGAAAWQRDLATLDFPNKNTAWSDPGDGSRVAALAVLTPRLTELGYLP